MPYDFFHALNRRLFMRGRRTWSIAIAVVMAIIAGGTFGVWYWGSIVKQRLPDWTWSAADARLVPDRVPESELQPAGFHAQGADLMVVNKGPGLSNQLHVRDYLSRDNKLSANDEEGGEYANVLAPGERSFHYRQSTHVVLYGHPPGVYYIILVIDPDNLIAETDEGNNAIALKIEICPGTQC